MSFEVYFFWATSGLLAVYGLVQLWLAIMMARPPQRFTPRRDRRISILVAARNEEALLPACLDTLLAQDYPSGQMEILVGDDRSEDATAEIIKAYAARDKRVKYVYIAEDLPNQRGKQNVLAQLFQLAQGEIILVTDADIEQPKAWAAHMVGGFHRPEVGMVSAPTIVDGRSLFAKMQAIDWLFGVSVIKALAHLDMPITAVGNNMAVTREAYDSTGGYEKIPFSITEDYRLFEVVRQAGWRFQWLHQPQVLNRTYAIEDLGTYFHQRKRWYLGGREGPWYALFLFGLQATVNPFLLAAIFQWSLPMVLGAIGLKMLADFLVVLAGAGRIGRWKIVLYYPLYPFYFFLSILILTIYFLLPIKVNWKGRKF